MHSMGCEKVYQYYFTEQLGWDETNVIRISNLIYL